MRGDCYVEGRASRVVCRELCIGGCENGGYYEERVYVTNVMDVVCR